MLTKNVVTAVSRAVKAETVQVCQDKIANSVWANVSRCSPNAPKLLDGAIQRESVSISGDQLRHTHLNPDKIGAFKRPELNTKSSARDAFWVSPWDG